MDQKNITSFYSVAWTQISIYIGQCLDLDIGSTVVGWTRYIGNYFFENDKRFEMLNIVAFRCLNRNM